jgi:hypothetical protein
VPRPRQSAHDVSVSKRGSRYLRPKPQCMELTCQPYWRAVVSLATNNHCIKAVRLRLIQVNGRFQSLLRLV